MKKNIKELFLYGIFGVLTTLINILSYYFLSNIFNINYIVSNIIAWIISVSFAYITNKLFVFSSRRFEVKVLLKEIISFFGARIATGLLDMLILYIGVSIFSINDIFIKVFSNVLVIILNFIFSKLIIFRRK